MQRSRFSAHRTRAAFIGAPSPARGTARTAVPIADLGAEALLHGGARARRRAVRAARSSGSSAGQRGGQRRHVARRHQQAVGAVRDRLGNRRRRVLATTALPAAIASSIAIGKPSACDGRQNTCARASSRCLGRPVEPAGQREPVADAQFGGAARAALRGRRLPPITSWICGNAGASAATAASSSNTPLPASARPRNRMRPGCSPARSAAGGQRHRIGHHHDARGRRVAAQEIGPAVGQRDDDRTLFERAADPPAQRRARLGAGEQVELGAVQVEDGAAAGRARDQQQQRLAREAGARGGMHMHHRGPRAQAGQAGAPERRAARRRPWRGASLRGASSGSAPIRARTGRRARSTSTTDATPPRPPSAVPIISTRARRPAFVPAGSAGRRRRPAAEDVRSCGGA